MKDFGLFVLIYAGIFIIIPFIYICFKTGAEAQKKGKSMEADLEREKRKADQKAKRMANLRY